MSNSSNCNFVSRWRSLSRTGCIFASVVVAATVAAADSARVIESTAVALFAQNQSDQALAYLEAQIVAATPAEKDMAVAQELTRIAFVFHGRKDRGHAEFVANAANARAEPRLADSVLSPVHFAVYREQAIACELILGDVAKAIDRVDCALRYIDQSGAGSALASTAGELRQRRLRLVHKLKILQRPS